jgi:hypothetical protein
MALDLTELQAVTDDYWEKQVNDIYFSDNILLYYLMAGKMMEENFVTAGELVDGGKAIRVFLEYAGSNSSTYGADTEIDDTKKTILNAARFRWGGAVAWNSIDLDDQVQNSGKAALVDLAFSKLRNIQKTIRKDLGATVYTVAADGKDVLGLGDLFENTPTTPYGSIQAADMPDWAPNVITTAEAISFVVMQSIRRGASVGQNKEDKPNLYITTEVLKDGYESTLQVQARYQDTKLASAGFENILFGGVPVVADDKQGAGTCDGLNLRFLKIKSHRDYAFTKPVWTVFNQAKPDKLVANTRWIGQLVCSNRKAHCRHTNMTVPV